MHRHETLRGDLVAFKKLDQTFEIYLILNKQESYRYLNPIKKGENLSRTLM